MSQPAHPERPFSATERFGPPAIWFVFLGVPIVWAVQFLVRYGLVSIACDSGSNLLLYVTTLVGALVVIAAGFVAWRLWQQPAAERGEPNGQTVARTRFFGFAGVLMSAVFLLAIIFDGISPLFLNPC